MFPPKPDSIAGATNAEPTNQTADLLFRIPLWMDLSMHLLPAVALIIGTSPFAPKLISDFFVLEEKFRPPASTTGAAALAGSFGLIYSAWIEHASAINGKFPYPFLNVMSIEQRIVFYIVSVVGALATFRLLNSLHR
jgi:hypothetical protein